MVEVLETLDDFEDESYGAYLDYQQLISEFGDLPSKLYLNVNHPHFHDMIYYAKTDNVEVITTNGVTKVC